MNTLERFTTVLAEHFGKHNTKPTSSFIKDLGLDSLDMIELVMAAEEEFGIEVRDDEAETLLTVGDAVKYIDRARMTSNPTA